MAKVVISGLSCRFPESEDAETFFANLVAGTDMVTADDRRWVRDGGDGWLVAGPEEGRGRSLTPPRSSWGIPR